MVDDLLDIGAEALVITAEAVATKINSDNETPELKEKKKQGLISAIFMIILMTGLIYLLFWRWDIFNEVGVDVSGIVAALIAFGIALVAMFIIGIGVYIKKFKEHKEIKRIYVLMALSAFCTILILTALYPELNLSIMQTISLFGFMFGITLMFLMLFNKIGDIKVNQFIRLPYHLLMRFCIPMMFVWILVLGAMKGKYGYNSVFLQEANLNLLTTCGEVIGGSLYRVIEIIFNIGVNRPDFFLFISIAITLFLLYDTIRYAFWVDEWPYALRNIYDEEDEEAQYFVDKSDDKFLSEEDLESFKKGKLRLNKNHLDEYKEVKDE